MKLFSLEDCVLKETRRDRFDDDLAFPVFFSSVFLFMQNNPCFSPSYLELNPLVMTLFVSPSVSVSKILIFTHSLLVFSYLTS
jgi:hypothetical protein